MLENLQNNISFDRFGGFFSFLIFNFGLSTLTFKKGQLLILTPRHWKLLLNSPIKSSVGTVLIFQFSPLFGTEALVPAVPRYRFWYLGSGSFFSIPGFQYKVFRGLFAFVSVCYWFCSVSISYRLQIRWNLKLWYCNLNCSKFSVQIQNLQFFRYVWF